MKQCFTKYKDFCKKVVSLLCAVSICCLLTVVGFSAPVVRAYDSVLDQWEDYCDEYLGEGASFTIEEMAEYTGGAPAFIYLYALSHLPYTLDEPCALESLVTMQGYYYHNGKHVCQSLIKSGEYSDSNLQTLCYSDEFTITPWVTGTVNRCAGAVNTGTKSVEIYYQTQTPMSNHIDGDGVIFPSTYLDSQSVGISCFCYYGGVIPTLTDNSNTSTYFWWGNRFAASGHNYVAGGMSTPYLSLGDYVESIGLDPTFEISPSNYLDYIINVYNPVIIELYPELEQFLFIPVEDETEPTTGEYCCQCNCYHEINVHVEPTINVYVENVFPSEWQEDFTFSTDPVETLPEPTMPTVNETQEMTLPTMEIDSSLSDGIHFWAELWTSFVFASDILPIVTLILLLTIAEWVLWHVGR